MHHHTQRPPRQLRVGRKVATLVALLAAIGQVGAAATTTSCAAADEPEQPEKIDVSKKRVVAGDISKQLLGVSLLEVTHEQRENEAAVARVQSLDATGAVLGTLVVDGNRRTQPIVYTSRDGSVASASASVEHRDDGVTVKTISYRANGAFLIVATEQAGSELVAVTYTTGTDAGYRSSSQRFAGWNTAHFQSEVQAWTAKNTDLAMLDSTPALRELYVLAMEAAWQQALGELMQGGGVTDHGTHPHPHSGLAETTEGIHKSPLCSQFIGVIAVGGVAALTCTTC